MRRRSLGIAGALGLLASVVVADVASAHPTVFPSPLTAPPSAAFSTSGDYATDVLGDPWDFENDEDVPPIPIIGTEGSDGISRANGILTVAARHGSLVKLVRTSGHVLPWGRDGLYKPIDASIYTRVSFSLSIDQGRRDMLVRYTNEAGQTQTNRVINTPTQGFRTYTIDLTQPGIDGSPSVWTGKIIRFDILAGGPSDGNPNNFTMQLDWVRIHRADAPVSPEGSPIVRMVSPSD